MKPCTWKWLGCLERCLPQAHGPLTCRPAPLALFVAMLLTQVLHMNATVRSGMTATSPYPTSSRKSLSRFSTPGSASGRSPSSGVVGAATSASAARMACPSRGRQHCSVCTPGAAAPLQLRRVQGHAPCRRGAPICSFPSLNGAPSSVHSGANCSRWVIAQLSW